MTITPTFIFKEELTSTNTYLDQLLDNEMLPEGTVVYCNSQPNGRGQGENKWESEPGKNITMSILFRPTFLDASRQFELNKAVSLATASFIAELIPESKVCIKWPNDIYVDDKKIAGILIEHGVMGSKLFQSICGIGINVNQTLFVSNAPNPISLKSISRVDYDLDDLLKKFVEKLCYYYSLIQQDKKRLDVEYINRLYRMNKAHEYVIDNKTMTASIVGVNEYGQLMLVDENGNEYCCGMKEVRFVI